MAYRPYTRHTRRYGGYGGGGAGINIFGPLTNMVKYLIIANVALFVLEIFAGRAVFGLLSLVPSSVFPGMQVWRLCTYMFVHADFAHILFNMLMLWWFGSPLEQIWGERRFLIYYFLTGTGAGVVCVPFYIWAGAPNVPVVGASGALFGILMAFALIYPNARVYLMFLLPVKVKWLVLFFMVVEFTATASYVGGEMSSVAHVAHLSGAVIGYFYLRGLMDIRAFWKKRVFPKTRTKRPYKVVRPPEEDDRGPWLH